MAEFHYAGVGRDGKRVEGKLDVPTEGDARVTLRGMGIRPTRIGKVSALNRDLGSLIGGGTVTTESLVVFTRQLQVLIGSGVRYDVRKDDPYSVYPELDFEVPIGRGEMGTLGDSFDRYIVRMDEMKQSCRILRQALRQIPKGPVIAKVPRNFKPAAGDAYVRVESARGDMGWYVVSDGTAFPHRCKIRTGSFSAISIIEKASRDLMIADLVAVIASLDLVAPEIDR